MGVRVLHRAGLMILDSTESISSVSLTCQPSVHSLRWLKHHVLRSLPFAVQIDHPSHRPNLLVSTWVLWKSWVFSSREVSQELLLQYIEAQVSNSKIHEFSRTPLNQEKTNWRIRESQTLSFPNERYQLSADLGMLEIFGPQQ